MWKFSGYSLQCRDDVTASLVTPAGSGRVSGRNGNHRRLRGRRKGRAGPLGAPSFVCYAEVKSRRAQRSRPTLRPFFDAL